MARRGRPRRVAVVKTPLIVQKVGDGSSGETDCLEKDTVNPVRLQEKTVDGSTLVDVDVGLQEDAVINRALPQTVPYLQAVQKRVLPMVESEEGHPAQTAISAEVCRRDKPRGDGFSMKWIKKDGGSMKGMNGNVMPMVSKTGGRGNSLNEVGDKGADNQWQLMEELIGWTERMGIKGLHSRFFSDLEGRIAQASADVEEANASLWIAFSDEARVVAAGLTNRSKGQYDQTKT
ncbi:hypothetical protein Dimus_021705 [Dionaea muscipula]